MCADKSASAAKETLSGEEERAVLAVNAAFYDAFAEGDMVAMEAVWSLRRHVVCIHPGWPPIQDRATVMKSWRCILDDPPSPKISCRTPHVVLQGATALVVCVEAFGDTDSMAATNIFVREGDGWRLIHHQSVAGCDKRGTAGSDCVH